MNKDLELARHLQRRFDEEQAPMQDADHLNSTQNLVHPDWENLDPTPDVHRLFAVFSRKFFQDRLACVTLEWSKRMYQCAGICYQSN
jgi:SprT-like domain-contaning protein Spartan